MIIDLKTCPQFIPVLASWDYGRWGYRRPHIDLIDTIKFYEAAWGDTKLHVPVLIDELRNIPMGMCSLLPTDPFAPDRPEEEGLYVVSLYIEERYRQQGLAKSLIAYAENYASLTGYDEVLCNTRNAEKLFLSQNWHTAETLNDKPNEKPLHFMRKILS